MPLSSIRFALSLLLLAETSAARADPVHGYQSWVAINLRGPIAGPVSLQADVQFRAFIDFTPAQILVRPGVGLRVAQGMTVTLGYAWTPSFATRGGGGFTDEHRLWEQFTWDYEVPGRGIQVQSRTRLEQRFRHPEGAELGARLRQQIRVLVPVLPQHGLSVVAFDEIFLALNDAGGEPKAQGGATPQWQFAVFDQNRAFAGLGYQVVPKIFRLEVGYLNIFLRRPSNPSGDLLNHVALLSAHVGW